MKLDKLFSRKNALFGTAAAITLIASAPEAQAQRETGDSSFPEQSQSREPVMPVETMTTAENAQADQGEELGITQTAGDDAPSQPAFDPHAAARMAREQADNVRRQMLWNKLHNSQKQ